MKAKRTKELAIPLDVKRAVAERDGYCCIWCGCPAPTDNRLAFSNAHYIARSQGGLGIEQNILTLCPICHREYDTVKRKEYRPLFRRYLREHYANWREKDLTYEKI